MLYPISIQFSKLRYLDKNANNNFLNLIFKTLNWLNYFMFFSTSGIFKNHVLNYNLDLIFINFELIIFFSFHLT
jgi:hypothetical protein